MRAPKVSVLMPVYNVRYYVFQAIRSVSQQTFTDWEMLVLDDGSTDGTADEVRAIADPRIRLFFDSENRGLSHRLNQGVALARGKYIARMDGDDLSLPDRFEKQMRFMDSHPEVDLVAGSMLVFRDDGTITGARVVGNWQHEQIICRAWNRIAMPHPTWMGRREWFAANPYRAEAARMEDFDLLYRTRRKARFATIADVVLAYRENQFHFGKNMRSRLGTLRFFWNELRSGDVITAAMGLSSQTAKLALDSIAVAFAAERILLRHRTEQVRSVPGPQLAAGQATINVHVSSLSTPSATRG